MSRIFFSGIEREVRIIPFQYSHFDLARWRLGKAKLAREMNSAGQQMAAQHLQ
jgi:hypothetical protein